ncbi:MAG: sigma-70 family RNA polymerase sigma factor [Selenomonadales bacterium]|nr:sigma-70 family RNA polymerase sigma factor [Selenomonadales bacterium]
MENDRQSIRRLLWRWGAVTVFCAEQHREIEQYKDLINSTAGLRAINMDGMPHGNVVSRPTEQAAERIERLKQMYEERVEWATEAIDKELRFEAALNDAMTCLNPTERAVIDLKYKRKYSLLRTARELHCAEPTVKYREKKAIDKLSKRITVD